MKNALYFTLIFLLFSCENTQKEKNRCTDEQIKKFEHCKINFNENFENFNDRYPNMKIPDSSIRILKDVEKLNLNELAEKYNLNDYQIDQLIDAVCITCKINTAFQKLDEKLKKSDLIIEENKKALDSISAITDKFDFSKIEPGQINLKDLKKAKNGKFYYLKDNKDTVYVKVQIAKYDD